MESRRQSQPPDSSSELRCPETSGSHVMKIELSFQGGPVATGSTNSESLICQALRFAGFEGLSGGTEKPSKYSRLGADHLD